MKSIVFCIKQVSGDRRLLDSPQLDPPPTPPYGGRGEASGGKSAQVKTSVAPPVETCYPKDGADTIVSHKIVLPL